MIVEPAFDDLARGGDHRVGDGGGQLSACLVRCGAGLLDDPERADDGCGLTFPSDREVLDRALSLRTPVAVSGDLDGAETVGFGACGGHGVLKSLRLVARPLAGTPSWPGRQCRGQEGIICGTCRGSPPRRPWARPWIRIRPSRPSVSRRRENGRAGSRTAGRIRRRGRRRS